MTSISPPFVIGIDEVGRGPLAGPVTACAVMLPQSYSSRKLPKRCLRDSKVMTLAEREDSYCRIHDIAQYGIGSADVAEIASLNIYHATLLAMQRALDALLTLNKDILAGSYEILIDGNAAPKWHHPTRTIIGGDAKIKAISAASIVAKVTRDRLMKNLANDHPEYGWHSNVGYATKKHIEALRSHGITPHHRMRFLRKYFPEAEEPEELFLPNLSLL